ncbi:MAG: hypothetical protein NDF54_03185 [archaeon GB-1867-035]|nr:hypothetical protein [Candidatus Culexmicrobium profundum]
MIKITTDTIPEALLKLNEKIVYSKDKTKPLKNILIKINSPEKRPFFHINSKERTRKIILKYYKGITENTEFKNKIENTIKNLKKRRETIIPLNLIFKGYNLGIYLKIKAEKGKIRPTLFYLICKKIEELNEQIIFTQIFQEDLSMGLRLEPGPIIISIKMLIPQIFSKQ